MSTDTPAQPIYNPWRESLENCISGDNYLRSSEYHELIGELDELYRLRAASPQPTAAQPLTDEQIDAVALHAVYDDDDTCAYRGAWCREVGRPFARAIERAHGIGASAAPAQAAQHLLQDTDRKLFDALERDPNARQHVRDSAEAIKDAQAVAELVEALRALLDEQDAQQGYATPAAYDRARAALSRAPGAGMPNDRIQPGAVAPRLE